MRRSLGLPLRLGVRWIPQTVIAGPIRRFYRKGPELPQSDNLQPKASHSKDQSTEVKTPPLFASSNKERLEDFLSPDVQEKFGFQELDKVSSVEETFLQYLKFISKGFKKSSKHLNRLQTDLSKRTLTSNKKLSLLFDYLLIESDLEIKRLKQGHIEGTDGETSHIPLADDEAESMIMNDVFKSLDSNDGPNKKYLHNTDFLYKIMTDLNVNDEIKIKTDILSIDQMVRAFELAKSMPTEGRKQRGILLAGKLLYSLKKVRMDPINESLYIDSLLRYRLFKSAYELFNSRKPQFRKRWWYELGLMILLRSNQLKSFARLLEEVDKQFKNDIYLNPRVIRLAIKKYLNSGNPLKAMKFKDRFLSIIDEHGISINRNTDENQNVRNFQEEDDVLLFLDELELPTTNDYMAIIESFLHKKDLKTAFKLIAKYLEIPGISEENLKDLITLTKFNLLSNFETLKKSIKPFINSNAAIEKLAMLEPLFSRIVEEFNKAPVGRELLFENVAQLASNPLLTGTVEEFVVKDISSMNDKLGTSKEDSSTPDSKKFYALLRVMLASKKENVALTILEKMEESLQKSQKDQTYLGSQFYAEANAHHYAQFIEYYTLLSRTANRRKRPFYEGKVSDIIDRMSDLKVETNSEFLVKLLTFYRETQNMNRCFEIINPILKSKLFETTMPDVSRSHTYKSRNITKALYSEIWKGYFEYYKIFNKELLRVKKNSNYDTWKHNSKNIIGETEVHPEFSTRLLLKLMVKQDNIMPDPIFFYSIIRTFVKQRDWDVIPVVLSMMVKQFDTKVGKIHMEYIMRALKKEYVIVETNKNRTNDKDFEITRIAAKEEIIRQKKEGLILKQIKPNQVFYKRLLVEIIRFLRFRESVTYSFEETFTFYDNMDIDKHDFKKSLTNVSKSSDNN
ncbi:hypothetical protein NCAS_0C05180 [Naumovozyma castellii]|uniref:Uncharacterized protein n=1 Tax=Naumovozyma castellii TaxID=27288 RepID=G0VDE6_NAUCA|nr:hypothetical protein NCAS_0C05180 [Naumovozyma castellii CBS 4309]CCC69508.1 hypothetical protein NCAS_0C05180 [Naumovozyma castellii CBS 4309]